MVKKRNKQYDMFIKGQLFGAVITAIIILASLGMCSATKSCAKADEKEKIENTKYKSVIDSVNVKTR